MENWKDIEGFEGLYQVSDHGRVRSLDRIDSAGKRRKGAIKRPGFASSKGYAVVCLGKNCKQYMRYVHRLVARAFLGEMPDKHVVNHIDGDCKNNSVSNLEIVTHQDNIKKQVRGTERTIFV